MKNQTFLDQLPELAAKLRSAGLVLSGEAALHAHLAAATRSVPGQPPRYTALALRAVEVIGPADRLGLPGVVSKNGRVAEVLRERLDLFSTNLVLEDGTAVRALTREAVLAELLARGGISIALAGTLVHVARVPPIDLDEVREILKAACEGHRFQPLLELIEVA